MVTPEAIDVMASLGVRATVKSSVVRHSKRVPASGMGQSPGIVMDVTVSWREDVGSVNAVAVVSRTPWARPSPPLFGENTGDPTQDGQQRSDYVQQHASMP
jgi:hypothetical protein